MGVLKLKYPSKETIERLRNTYPKGTRIELVEMDDQQAPPVGTLGTIRGFDDIGSVLVDWANGSRLNLVYGVDKFKIIE